MDERLPLDAFEMDPAAVRERFAWALRNSNSRWLWPEITIERWGEALAQIETATRQILTTGTASEVLAGCARTIGLAGFTSGMGPLLAFWLEQGQLKAEPEVAAMLDLHLRHNTLRMPRMAERATAVVSALAEHGIATTVLKGMHTAYAYFPAPATRPLTDADLLVAPDDEPLAAEVLGEMGFVAKPRWNWPPPQQSWRRPDAPTEPRSLEFLHADDPWCIDLQISLNRRYSNGSPLLQLDRARGPECLEPWALSPKATALAPAAQMLNLAVHAGCQFGSLTLLRLTELVFVARKAGAEGRLDWDELAELGERTGALPAAYPALRLCDSLVPGIVPPELLHRLRRQVPAAVLRVLDRLTPATAQRVIRCSFEERFMWTTPSLRRALEAARWLVVPTGSLGLLISVQRARLLQVVRGRVSWRSPGTC